MFCPNCGKSVPDDARFCPFCGNVFKGKGAAAKGDGPAKQAAAQPTPPPSPPVSAPAQPAPAAARATRQSAPTGVKLVAFLTLLSGLLSLLTGALVASMAYYMIVGYIAYIDIVLGVILLLPILFGILYLWIGWGLWNLRRSALNAYLVLFILSFIIGIGGIYLDWYYFQLWAPSFTEYVVSYIYASPWVVASWAIGWLIFIYLLAVRHMFNGVPRQA